MGFSPTVEGKGAKMTYTLINPTLPYGNQSYVSAMNASGYFVGYGYTDDNGIIRLFSGLRMETR